MFHFDVFFHCHEVFVLGAMPFTCPHPTHFPTCLLSLQFHYPVCFCLSYPAPPGLFFSLTISFLAADAWWPIKKEALVWEKDFLRQREILTHILCLHTSLDQKAFKIITQLIEPLNQSTKKLRKVSSYVKRIKANSKPLPPSPNTKVQRC